MKDLVSLFRRNTNPTIVGVRHQIGILEETEWLDRTISWSKKKIKPKNKVMLEIPEYPLGENFRKNVPSRVRFFYNELTQCLENMGAIILCAEDESRWANDKEYDKEHVRDELFIEKLKTLQPNYFLVGFGHIDYLRERLPAFRFINLVNERRDERRYFWLSDKFLDSLSKYNS